LVLHRAGDAVGAKAAYRQAIDSGHSDEAPKAAVNLGALLHDEGNAEGAKAAYRQVIHSGHPAAPIAAVNLAAILKEQGDLEGAKAAYRKAIDSGDAEMSAIARRFLDDLPEDHARDARHD
jgi:tetratricopeptide (TPR) repeat protein